MPRKKKESVAEAVLAQPAPEPKKRTKRYSTFAQAAAAKTDSVAEAPVNKIAKPKGRMNGTRSRAELQKLTTDGDLVDIWERRILNPGHTESQPIRIKTPGMKLRWINLSTRGRFQRARYEQGWVPVHKSELQDEREIFGVSFTSEGYVCRGEKQSEMLMRIPLAVYRKIQERIAEQNTQSYKKLRKSMGSAGFGHFKDKYGGSAGDQAEEAASQFVGSVKFGTEKVSSDELFE
jgi:hypothetical protein